MSNEDAEGPVVVEVDGLNEWRVLEYACTEARGLDTGVRLVRPYRLAGYSPVSPMAPMLPTSPLYGDLDPRQVALADLDEASAYVRRHRPDVDTEELPLEMSRNAALQAASQGARLLVVARRHGTGPYRGVAAQSTLNLAGRSACPVIVVPPSWQGGAKDPVYVGADGTDLSREAIEFGYATAARRRVQLVVIHASRSAAADPDLTGMLEKHAARHPEVHVTRLITDQHVTDALVGASAHAGLLVLGAHASRLPHDPNARRVVATAHCPVAIVKHVPGALDEADELEHTAGTTMP